jgi:membrane protein
VRLGAALTAVLFLVGKYTLGFYLGSGGAGSAYGAAGSLITMLIWIYYAAQIVLFGAEFTQVYAQERGRGVRPAKYAVRVKRNEIELRRRRIGPTRKPEEAPGSSIIKTHTESVMRSRDQLH